MKCRALIIVSASIGICLSAGALTGSGDSAVGPLETVPPEFLGLDADPPQAGQDEAVTITFSASETLDMVPAVLVNGNVADFVSEAKSGDYTYEYWVLAEDPLGMATIEIAGQDAVGNPGSLSNATVLEIVEAEPSLPIYAWPLGLVLLLAAVCMLRMRGAGRRAVNVLLMALLFGLAAATAAAQAPTVSNVMFVQQPDGAGGTEVVITYDLTSPNGPSEITPSLSKDGGSDGFSYAVTSVTGDLSGVTTGTAKQIVWDIAADYPNEDIPNARIRVTADDGLVLDMPEMLPVPAGAFQMGDVFEGEGSSDELPVHEVTLSAYEIGKYEVTNQQIADVYNWANGQGYFAAGTLDATTATLFGQELLDLDSSYCQITFTGTAFVVESRDSLAMADHPVVEISWYGAAAYCNWLSEIAGLTPVYETVTWTANFTNDGYHLPTEAQWEKAAAYDVAAPTQDHWRYGQSSDSISQAGANYYSGGYANPLGLSGSPYTSPVGWYDGVNAGTTDSPSPVGCYDMTGNVWEWCHDRYDSSYYTTGGPPWNDPTGPGPGFLYRLLRGSGWGGGGGRSANRNGHYAPDSGHDDRGFRVARTQMVAPVVESFAINGGAASTPGLTVTLDNTCSGVPSEYMASEAGNFSGASWQSYNTAPSFTLSAGAGTKTVYFKVRNAKGESAPMSDTIDTLGYDVPEMLPVPAGTFLMGNSGVGDDVPFSTGYGEDPQHTVNLSAYEIGKYEVTNQQIADVYNWANGQGYFTTLNANTATAFAPEVEVLDLDSPNCQITYTGTAFEVDTRDTFSMASHPVVAISWYGAVAYCNWLSEIAGLTPVYETVTWTADFTNDGYHLPTDAQWERAAAWDGAKHWIYGFLSDTLTEKDRCNYYDINPDFVNPLGLTSYPYTSPVGWFDGNNSSPNGPVPTVDSPSPMGCYDMSGNVWEWCHDWYDSYPIGPVTDPEGPAPTGMRVLRGGAWYYGFGGCRAADRDSHTPDNTSGGFRISRTQMVAPVAESFAINGGAGSTAGLTVTLNNTCSGVPSEYMASEAGNFSGASWEPYDTAPSFTLSAGAGTKTVYFKVRNAKGESAPTSDTIDTLGYDVPEMLPVSAGDFQMGDVFGEGDSVELPVHPVTLSAYEIGKYEVTNQQIADVYNWAKGQGYFTAGTLNANTATLFGQQLLDLDASGCQITYSGLAFVVESRNTYSMADHPVVEISWFGAVAYCNWLSELAGLTAVYDTSTWTADFLNDGYHSPTEAQWEKAAAYDVAAPTQDHWRYGQSNDSISSTDVTYDYANPLGLTAYPYTSPVGWYDGVNAGTADSPSPVGAYDMSGNVWEWCHDWYDGNYYGSSPEIEPTGPAGPLAWRVLRSGSWNHNANRSRAAYRTYSAPDNTYSDYGIRVARTP